MIQLLEKPKSLRVLHLEDDKTSQAYFDHIIKAKLEKVKIKNVDDCISFYCKLPFEKPHILVIDWGFVRILMQPIYLILLTALKVK